MSTLTSVEILKQKLCFYNDWREQNLHRPKIPKIPDEHSAGFMHRPKIPKNPKTFRNYQARPWQSSKTSWDSWESWACAWILHFVHQESWESWACAGLVSCLHLWSYKTCTGPRFPRFLMNKVQDSCTGPRFSRIPRFFRNFARVLPDSSKNSWDSWESWACAWILHFVHQDSWESACAGLASFPHHWNHQICIGPRFPRFLMNRVQDSCTGPRFPKIPRFLGTIKQDPDKVPKNLGILETLGPVHESCTLFVGILGNLGPVQVLWKSYVKLCCFFEKMHFPRVFWWWTSELVQRVFIFWWNFWKWRTGFWFCIIGCVYKINNWHKNYFTYSVFKKHWYLQWFLHVQQIERWK